MMIIENADRFGLAQLHQLRGRVGRGHGRVVLRARLRLDRRDRASRGCKAVAELSDGFELAERDFELRREGDVLGFAQSGLPGLRVASLTRGDHRELAVRGPRRRRAIARRDGCARPGPAGPRAARRASSSPAGSAGSWPRTRRAARDHATMPDAGRVIAGTARGDPARRARDRARGRSATASSRRSSRSSSRTCRGARFLDLFAGSGAAGIEALSRGAAPRHVRRARRAAPSGRSAPTSSGPGWPRGDRATVVRADVADLAARPGPRGERADRRRARRPAVRRRRRRWPRRSRRSARCSRRAAGSSPSTSGGRRRRPRSGC